VEDVSTESGILLAEYGRVPDVPESARPGNLVQFCCIIGEG
jgi:hypothetical protein